MENFELYLKDLPVIPDVAMKVISMAEDNMDISFSDLEEIIRVDPAITSKILKVANSALYARQTQIKSLEKAISLLGFKTIKNLVLIVSATSAFKSESNLPFYKSFWANSLLTAFYAKEIALFLGNKEISDEVFLAGLIHRIGQVALYRHDPNFYDSIKDGHLLDLDQLEESHYQISHRELGAGVLESWSFPTLFIDCTREYGSPNITSKYKKEIIIVSLADLITKEVITGEDLFENINPDIKWCDHLGILREDFIREKQKLISNVNNSRDYRECQSVFC